MPSRRLGSVSQAIACRAARAHHAVRFRALELGPSIPMHAQAWAGVISGCLAAGCQTYSAAPVDVGAHLREFLERTPARAGSIERGDGLDLREARRIALLLNPELRAKRLAAGVAAVSMEEAGRWSDPVLGADFVRILESVDHRWLSGGALAVTLPITGRPGLERALAESRNAQALVDVRVAEARVVDALDLAWARWSASRASAELIDELVRQLTELEAVAARLADAHAIGRVEARSFAIERIAREAASVRASAAAATAAVEIAGLLGLPAGGEQGFVPELAVELRITDAARRRERLVEAPGVATAHSSHVVSERDLELAIREQWPELTLLPGFEEEDAEPRARIGFSVPLPLWNRNARAIAEARARREVAAETLRGSVERAAQDLARAEARRAAAAAQRALVETQLVPLAERQVDEIRQMVELGRLDTLLVLTGIVGAFEARSLALEAALAEAEAVVELNALAWPVLDATEAEDGR